MTKKVVLSVLVAFGAASWMPAHSQELGSITFPTSGAPAAQAAFLEGDWQTIV